MATTPPKPPKKPTAPINAPTTHHIGGGRHVVLRTPADREAFVRGYMKGHALGRQHRQRAKQMARTLAAPPRPPAHQGLIASPAPGRGDHITTQVPGGSYVMPADVVSGIGKGNTLAGGQKLAQAFPPGPTPPTEPQTIAASGGEYVVPPGAVAQKGGGNLERGHDKFDQMVKALRKSNVKRTQQLPGPRKD